ncbi:MAG: PepSY domain-containing protein [Parvularculaceae bacterium]
MRVDPPRAHRWRRRVYAAHGFFAAFLFLQMTAWLASGLVMTWLPLDLVRGETTAAVVYPRELKARAYAAPGGVVAQLDGAQELRLKTWRGRPVYEAESAAETALFDAMTGERLTPISRDLARKIAEDDFLGDGTIVDLDLLSAPPQEYRGPRPVWRAQFDDPARTRLYVSPDEGRVMKRRNKYWRLFDFFWMLHIMDYDAREDFNNPLVRVASLTGLLFVLTGVAALGFRARDLFARRRRQARASRAGT